MRPTVETPRPLVELSQREQREYSLTRAILDLVDAAEGRAQGRDRPPPSLEQEIGQTLGRYLQERYAHGSFPLAVGRAPNALLVPTDVLARALLDTATATRGAELKFVEPGPFIEVLRNMAQVGRLGATVLPGLQGDLTLPRQTSSVTSSWVPESPTADVAESNLLLNQVALAPRELRSTTSFSRKLLVQSRSSAAVDGVVARDMFGSAAVELDRVAINGSGANNEPRGILNTSGIGNVAGGANGAVPSVDHATDLEAEVSIDNADVEVEPDGRSTIGFITTPKVRQRLRKSPAIVGGNALPAWRNGQLVDRPAAVSTNVPSNLTKGTSTTIAHALIFGRWAEVLIGEWGVGELIVDPFSKKRRGDVEVTFTAVVDVALRHAPSFAAMLDALP